MIVYYRRSILLITDNDDCEILGLPYLGQGISVARRHFNIVLLIRRQLTIDKTFPHGRFDGSVDDIRPF